MCTLYVVHNDDADDRLRTFRKFSIHAQDILTARVYVFLLLCLGFDLKIVMITVVINALKVVSFVACWRVD